MDLFLQSNATLKQMADLALKSQEWLDKSPAIMNSLTKLNQTVPMIKVWNLTMCPVVPQGLFLSLRKKKGLETGTPELMLLAHTSVSLPVCLLPSQRYSWCTFPCRSLLWNDMSVIHTLFSDSGLAEGCWKAKMSGECSSVCKLTFCLMEWSSQPRPGKKWLFQKMKQYL